ncbi:MAG: VWA domain-containing protein [Chloroflexi bacterium]|nr:VWA domain-containing protein [Chloroflexota bacterium]
MRRYRYSEWDGSQDRPDVDAEKLIDELGRNLMSDGDLSQILNRMQQRGVRDGQGRWMPSIQDLIQRLRQRRQSQLDKYDLGSMVDEIRQKLENILKTEREGIQRRLDEAREKANQNADKLSPEEQKSLLKAVEDMAARNLQKLDDLPPDIGGQVKELSDYNFMDEDARRQFQELMDMLKKHAMESYGQQLMQNVRNLDPAALNAMKEMFKALNQMLEQRMRGEEPDFEGFMQQFGGYFGPNPPQNLDELIERLQNQIAQAQSILDSLSPKDREALQDMLRSALDDETQYELAKLAANLDTLFPTDDLRRQYPFAGEESISFSEAMKLMEKLQDMDKLEKQLKDSQYSRSLDDIDEKLLKELLGDEAAADLEKLRDLTRALEAAGYIRRKDGRWELTPRGIRRIGEKALHDIFAQLRKDRIGGHNLKLKGAGGEKLEETRKYEAGDDFDIDLQKTLMNAICRETQAPPLKLNVDDFEIFRREGLTRTAVVIMLDMSLSMFLNGYFDAAKRTAIALDALMRSQYPKDTLHIIGFSRYAREIKIKDLLYVRQGGFEQGTNLQHALSLAGKLLARQRCTNSQVILITDGEPTAHLEGAYAFFEYPPSLRTLQLTLREVRNCTQKGIVINTFMFDDTQFLSNFVDRMAYLNKGRVFFANADNLGKYVLVDYVARKKKILG